MFAKNTLEKLNGICHDEVLQAYAEHGDMFSSDNESWGVMMEELEEVKQNMKTVGKAMKNFFDSTRTAWADEMERRNCLTIIQHYALLCAAECCQVAACAVKAAPGVYNPDVEPQKNKIKVKDESEDE